MSVEASGWAINQVVGDMRAKFVLVIIADVADCDNCFSGNRAYVAQVAEMTAVEVDEAFLFLRRAGFLRGNKLLVPDA